MTSQNAGGGGKETPAAQQRKDARIPPSSGKRRAWIDATAGRLPQIARLERSGVIVNVLWELRSR